MRVGCLGALDHGGFFIVALPDHYAICGLAQNNILDLPPHNLTHWSESTIRYLAKYFNLDLIDIEFEPISDFNLVCARKSH